jgi:hypothetical protein
MLVHLAVDQDQIRFHLAHGPDESVDRQRFPGLFTAVAQVQQPVDRRVRGIGFEELLVPAPFQRNERKTVKLDDSTVFDTGGEGQPVTGGGKTPAELHARVEQTPESLRHDEDVGHAGSAATDNSAGGVAQ